MYADEKSDEALYRGSDRTKEGNFQRRSWREGPHPRGTADRRPWFGLCAEIPRRFDWRLCAELRASPHRLLADVRPEGGARCVSSARRDLCGGRGVILVPTATHRLLLRKQQREFGTQLPVRREVWSDHVVIAGDVRTHVLVTDLEHSTNAATDRHGPLLIRRCQPVRRDHR